MWNDTPPQNKAEYEWLYDAFTEFSENEPGTHPRYIAAAMEEAAQLAAEA